MNSSNDLIDPVLSLIIYTNDSSTGKKKSVRLKILYSDLKSLPSVFSDEISDYFKVVLELRFPYRPFNETLVVDYNDLISKAIGDVEIIPLN